MCSQNPCVDRRKDGPGHTFQHIKGDALVKHVWCNCNYTLCESCCVFGGMCYMEQYTHSLCSKEDNFAATSVAFHSMRSWNPPLWSSRQTAAVVSFMTSGPTPRTLFFIFYSSKIMLSPFPCKFFNIVKQNKQIVILVSEVATVIACSHKLCCCF